MIVKGADNICVICGTVIPEGRMICPMCGTKDEAEAFEKTMSRKPEQPELKPVDEVND